MIFNDCLVVFGKFHIKHYSLSNHRETPQMKSNLPKAFVSFHDCWSRKVVFDNPSGLGLLLCFVFRGGLSNWRRSAVFGSQLYHMGRCGEWRRVLAPNITRRYVASGIWVCLFLRVPYLSALFAGFKSNNQKEAQKEGPTHSISTQLFVGHPKLMFPVLKVSGSQESNSGVRV